MFNKTKFALITAAAVVGLAASPAFAQQNARFAVHPNGYSARAMVPLYNYYGGAPSQQYNVSPASPNAGIEQER